MRRTLWAIAGLVLAAVALQLRQARGEQKLESPAYSVEKTDGPFEWRRYEGYLVAEVSAEGPRKEAINRGFRILARYIFGSNESRTAMGGSEKMEMTTPVTQLPDAKAWKVRFVMPKKYSLGNLPAAKDERIQFLSVPPGDFLALKFSGDSSDAEVYKQREKLEDYLRSQGIVGEGEPFFAFYNSPMTAPFLRRNEVLIKLAERKIR